jgi:transcriptional regulator with XRE-family HTH domain
VPRVAVRKAEQALEHRLASHRKLVPLLALGSAEGVRAFVVEVSNFFTDLGVKAGLPPEQAPVITGAVVYDAFPSLLCYRRGERHVASRLLIARWRAYLGQSVSPRDLRVSRCRPTSEDDILLRVFVATVSGLLVEQAKTARGRAILARLGGALGLSHDDLGQMLGVSGETVRRWAHGKITVPEQQLAKLDSTDAALTRLQALFRPERLPEAVRRPAELFHGERAIDWIQRGRIAEVADRYEMALSYQA